MSKVEVDQVDPQSGTTLTLGTSGDTVSIPSGVTLANAGTVTGIPTSALSGTIATAQIADDAVTLAKMAPGTDGNLITYDASGNPAAVATGSAGQVLTSAGAGAVPTFADAGGGMHTLISTATISNAATAAVTGMDSTYSRYLVTINNLVPANNEVSVYMQVIIGGSVQTGANYPYGNNTRNSGSGAEGNESGGSTFFKISKSDMGNATGENYSGEVTLYNPSETSLFKNIGWRSVYTVGNGTVDSNIGGGMYSSGQAAITGISIKMASGNITSAVIKLYGIT